MDELTNREAASGIWLGVLLIALVIAAVRSASVRSSAGGVIRAFFAWKIQFVFALYFTYVTAVVVVAARLGLWHFGLLKDTLIITITLGIPPRGTDQLACTPNRHDVGIEVPILARTIGHATKLLPRNGSCERGAPRAQRGQRQGSTPRSSPLRFVRNWV